NYVTKFPWTADRRKPEADLLRIAHEREVEGIAKSIGDHCITGINEMHSGLTFKKPYSFRRALRDAIKAHRSLYLKGDILH
ncbi:hypothetical protein K505DRAFT_196444, partial [Melanomma pulvis-pyrius CBS 109.77]